MNVLVARISFRLLNDMPTRQFRLMCSIDRITAISKLQVPQMKNSQAKLLLTRTISNFERCNQIQVKKDDSMSTHTKKGKAKQVAKDTTYGVIVVAGIACMVVVFYLLYNELLSKAGPTQVFGDALEKCRNHQDLAVALGTPIEGYGETNSRGRRRHVSHLSYIDSLGRDAMRLKFYVKGSSGRTGTVHVDSVIVGRKISYRYIIAYLDTYPKRIIIVLDNRSEVDKGDTATLTTDL